MFEHKMRVLMDEMQEIIDLCMPEMSLETVTNMRKKDLKLIKKSIGLLNETKSLYIEIGETLDKNEKTLKEINSKLDEILALERNIKKD